MAMPAGYKPSPLGYGSPRSSPFRRPESPAASSGLTTTSPTAHRSQPPPALAPLQTTPTRHSSRSGSGFAHSRLGSISSVDAGDNEPPSSPVESRTPRRPSQFDGSPMTTQTSRGGLGSPARISASPLPAAVSPLAQQQQQPSGFGGGSIGIGGGGIGGHGNALSQLQPAQVRVMRDGFQILDRDGDGVVNREDVADMLGQLGLPSSAPEVSRFFPPGAPTTTTLAAFVHSMAGALAAMSPAAELLAAFAAFDDDDSGQVDVAELRDALLHTAPNEPSNRNHYSNNNGGGGGGGGGGEGETTTRPQLAPHEVDRVLAGFSGRRAFSRNSVVMLGGGGGGGGLKGMGMGMGSSARGGGGDVFRYQEFVGSVTGAAGTGTSAGAGGEQQQTPARTDD
ncbi:EF-hand [Xylariaceae sp. FL0804]|nr:EF-hand [Xylariaceae sp. FL0804]